MYEYYFFVILLARFAINTPAGAAKTNASTPERINPITAMMPIQRKAKPAGSSVTTLPLTSTHSSTEVVDGPLPYVANERILGVVFSGQTIVPICLIAKSLVIVLMPATNEIGRIHTPITPNAMIQTRQPEIVPVVACFILSPFDVSHLTRSGNTTHCCATYPQLLEEYNTPAI